MKKFAKLIVPVEIGTPTRIFRVEKFGTKKINDVDVTTKYEHGYDDATHFFWMLEDGRYVVCRGIKHICGVTVKDGKLKRDMVEEPKGPEEPEPEPDAIPEMVVEE